MTTGTAVISECGRYRYRLTRRVGESDRIACFVMLNPSTADAMKDDNTIRRCKSFAAFWDCGLLIVVNLFALRATDPNELRRDGVADPVGPDNMDNIALAYEQTHRSDGLVVCAWGAKGAYMDQDLTVLDHLDIYDSTQPQCLRVTKDGHPGHPLYIPLETKLKPFNGRLPIKPKH